MILVLKIIGYVLLAIIALLLLVLIMPLTFNVEYFRKQLTVRFKLIFPFVIYPKRKKKEKAKKEKTKKDNKKSQDAGPQKSGHIMKDKGEKNSEKSVEDLKSFYTDFVKEFLPDISDAVKKLLKNIKIRNVIAIIPIYNPDPMTNGMLIGDAWIAIGNIIPLLNNVFNIGYNRIDVIPDFENHYQNDIMLAADIRSSILLLIISVAALAIKYLKMSKKDRRK